MFQDLDATLKAMLTDLDAPAVLRAADISFDTPDKGFQPTLTTVNLFLHDVQENRTLRDDTPLLERTADGYLSRRPPLRVDCTYLATTWSTRSGGLKAEEEHRLLGLLLLWLHRFPVIEDRFLRGELKTPPPLYPLPSSVAQTKEGQGMGQFWTALGVAPRPAIALTVTIGMQLSEEPDAYPATDVLRIASTSLSHPALAGRVLDSGLAPLAGTPVTVVEAQRRTVAGAAGRFAFDQLEFGTYTLLVQPPNRPELRREVRYAADSQVHDVILPGP
ncbi:Pvc16 family protein [Streptomyces sp. NBC_01142]|uniref:Pvc16 family protein n=1 Tax=Streptomyces sp. NBC_01142 TaxID=2975865 RepID=UPI002253F7FB|nr:Pvc16 family protein [Streptomyces sp. NBC_01142]MCX4821046.1 Pvc16 family protein [Streptomyces sp. NBC_01142]